MFTLIVFVDSTCPECAEIVLSTQDSGIQLYTLLSTSLFTGNYITHELCLGWCWVVGVLTALGISLSKHCSHVHFCDLAKASYKLKRFPFKEYTCALKNDTVTQ